MAACTDRIGVFSIPAPSPFTCYVNEDTLFASPAVPFEWSATLSLTVSPSLWASIEA